jgi:hypothetical protein
MRPCLFLLALISLAAACGGKTKDSGPAAPKVYEEFDVMMHVDGTCFARTRTEHQCPDGASCAPPATKPIECPAGITEGATLHLTMWEDLTCSIDGAPTPCPAHDEGPVEVPPEE